MTYLSVNLIELLDITIRCSATGSWNWSRWRQRIPFLKTVISAAFQLRMWKFIKIIQKSK